jgi:hypothetical protein
MSLGGGLDFILFRLDLLAAQSPVITQEEHGKLDLLCRTEEREED